MQIRIGFREKQTLSKFYSNHGRLTPLTGKLEAASIALMWSGRPGSNRRHSAWEADVLPLNYSRLSTPTSTEEMMVELSGIEPLTSSLRTRRSPS